MFGRRRAKSCDSKKDEEITIDRGEQIIIGGLDGKTINSIPKVVGHPEINPKLKNAHEGVFLKKGMDGEVQSFYLDPRQPAPLEDQMYEKMHDDAREDVSMMQMLQMFKDMKNQISELKTDLSKRNSRATSRYSSTATTPRLQTRVNSRSRNRREIPRDYKDKIMSNLHQGLLSQSQQPHGQEIPKDINRKMQVFSKNKTMYENLPKLEVSNKSHFKRYLEDMELQFLVWEFPEELLIPISIQRCYSELRSDLLWKFKENKIKTKDDLTKYLAKLCLKGESYTGVKDSYILSNKMTESQIDFSNLYQTITSKQVEHLISLDKSLTSADHKRERTRLAVEMFKASIHPKVLAHCQTLGKADDIEDLLGAANDYAQGLSTIKRNSLAYDQKRVYLVSDDTPTDQYDESQIVELVRKIVKIVRAGIEHSESSTRPRCAYCNHNKLDPDVCSHCWKHSDKENGFLWRNCQVCKDWKKNSNRDSTRNGDNDE